MVDGYFLGAYATAPSLNGWNEDLEGRYYDALAQLQQVRGLEVPFNGAFHAHDEEWLLEHLVPSWDVVLTLIPGTMSRLMQNAEHGLAACSESGRAEAVAFTRAALDATRRLNDRAGRSRVVAVDLHSAPRRHYERDEHSSIDAFTDSLVEIASWNWEGARLCVEHCDALRPDHAPFKGFLEIEDEIAAVKRANDTSGSNIGVAINWGRSVLEDRDPVTAVKHIAQAVDAGVLAGLMFSGCSGEDTPWNAWDDTHMPHAPAAGIEFAAPGSLMDERAIGDALDAASGSSLTFLGAKITAFPAHADLRTRVGLNDGILRLLSRCLAAARPA